MNSWSKVVLKYNLSARSAALTSARSAAQTSARSAAQTSARSAAQTSARSAANVCVAHFLPSTAYTAMKNQINGSTYKEITTYLSLSSLSTSFSDQTSSSIFLQFTQFTCKFTTVHGTVHNSSRGSRACNDASMRPLGELSIRIRAFARLLAKMVSPTRQKNNLNKSLPRPPVSMLIVGPGDREQPEENFFAFDALSSTLH